MAPHSRVLICRHSQAEHNVDLDYSIPDAPLTALGRKQSGALPRQTQQEQQQVDAILSSGLRRTLQSTLLGWAPAVQRLGIANVVVMPQLQECNDFPCDTGSAREELERDPEFKGFDFSLLTPDWTSKKGFWAPDPESIDQRARWVRRHVRERPEKTILIVAHGDFIRRLTGDVQGPSTYQWKNAEVRAYRFDPASVDSDAAFFQAEGEVAVAGGHDQTSTEMIEDGSAADASTGPSLPGLSSTGASLGLTGEDSLREIEERVKVKAYAVQSQASELQELEARLAAAERKKAELEAKGIKI
ncbi:phosphoglycerate mutase-like protein [Tilletiopsis washingtonensis]|uniref:Phosphoglycerate mutase-like protein n=1 Tax=Tilletiopsis washingtonensis TaxID=58919 RepID=A0A316ZFG2_9BASI|nr:phosphoglycerate mutase-like protein [Tilletiopsis washingtonensis]PWN99774.1 phosphoglycerate mutase-like protein [Tilletiopsis washingtonensis]